jgi:isopenicillin-N N-acyltransferase-like protein
MSNINILKISGTPYQMGYQHGSAFREAIHEYTAERVRLCGDPKWSGIPLQTADVLALAEACLPYHQDYAPELMEELQGMADATGLSLAELIITNGFTDFVDLVYTANQQKVSTLGVDDCTAFLIPANATADGHAYFGQTWDMHATAAPYVLMLDGKPDNAPAFMSFTTMGCIGQIGMNTAGITIGINNIMGQGQIGVMWPFIVRKALAQTTLEDALACVVEARRAGAHNFLLMDKNGHGYNVEAMADSVHIEKLDTTPIIHTNHCLIDTNRTTERERHPASLESSVHRLERANELLGQQSLDLDALMALTRDEEAICVEDTEPLHVASLGATIMRPQTGEMWAVQGLPRTNEYERFLL